MGLTTQTFDILTRIGMGNGSLVYRAVHKETLRQVALKLLTQDTDTDHRIDLPALAEATARLKQIAGNHVCQLLDFIQDEEGPVLVYEFASGTSGAEFPQQRKLDAQQAVDVAAQIISALRSGERQRTPHGDLKPSNVIFVEMAENRPFTFVIDWGLAAFRTAAPEDSLPFLAPERLLGGAVSHQADLFSAGATLFYLLTGKVLAGGGTAQEVLAGWSKAKPEMLAQLRPDLSPKLTQWITGLLELDPQKRPPSAVEAGNALAALNPPAPMVPPESIRPRPLSASQKALASGLHQQPASRVAAQAGSGIAKPPGSGVRAAPVPAVAPIVTPIPAPTPAAMPPPIARPVVAQAATPVPAVARVAVAAATPVPVGRPVPATASGAAAVAVMARPAPVKTASTGKAPILFVVSLIGACIGVAIAAVWWFTRDSATAWGQPNIASSSAAKADAALQKAREEREAREASSGGSKKSVSQNAKPAKPSATAAKKTAPPAMVPWSEDRLLVVDSFDYAENERLAGASGGRAWAASWSGDGARVEKGSLSPSGHKTRGNRIVVPAGEEPVTLRRDVGSFEALAVNKRRWYFAAVVSHTDGTPASGGEVQFLPCTAPEIEDPLAISVKDAGPDLVVSLSGASKPLKVPGPTAFLVWRVEWSQPKNGKSEVSTTLLVNPKLTARNYNEAGERLEAKRDNVSQPSQVSLEIRKLGGTAATEVDEIRYAKSWPDVMFQASPALPKVAGTGKQP